MALLEWRLVLGLVALFSVPASASAAPITYALPDLDGHLHTQAELTSAPLTVFVYLACDCPIANGYAPELRRLAALHHAVHFVAVFADPAEPVSTIARHQHDFALPLSTLLDRDQELARQLDVAAVPTAAIVDAHGTLLYSGRIDDRYLDLAQRRPRADDHSLENAVDAALAGRPISPSRLPVVGCTLPRRSR